MARNSYTEVTKKGFGKRLSESISGAILGGIMFIAAFPLLWWNEGRAIGEHRALKEGAGAVVHVDAGSVDAGNDGKLVHVTGLVDADPAIDDQSLGVSVDALALRRVVEMYQWKESRDSKEEKKFGGGSETVTEYKYSTEWNDDPIDSSDFRYTESHENPTEWPLRSDEFSAQTASLGGFALSATARGSVGNWRRLEPGSALRFPKAFGEFRSIGGGALYLGGNPEQPEVGDVRIRFEYQPEEVFSIVARQAGDELAEYVASNGRTVLLVESGEVPAATMFEGAQRRNTIFTWVLRGFGTLGMWLGLSLVFAPISLVLDILPMLGTIGSWGIGLVTGLISLLMSVLTIALAWVFYRPLLGGTLIALVVALFVWSRSGKKTAAAPAGPPAAPPLPPPPPPAAPL
jgi:hypothetical protein